MRCEHAGEQESVGGAARSMATGWRSWKDQARTRKMVKHCLSELVALVSEPRYSLFLGTRAEAVGDRHDVQVMRYKLIQWLMLSKLAISDLEARVIAFGNIERSDYAHKYGKFNEYFGTADEQSEAVSNCVKARAKMLAPGQQQVMFPNWPCERTLVVITDVQLRLLSAPYMWLLWQCVLHHYYAKLPMTVAGWASPTTSIEG